MKSFKNRWKLLQEEVIEKKWKRIYVERKIKDIMKVRYADWSINTNSSYIYQKMDKLVMRKIYVPVWNIWNYAHQQWFINIFDLHRQLEEMIRIYHLPKRHQKIYTQGERQYMKEFIKKRGMREDRGLIVY